MRVIDLIRGEKPCLSFEVFPPKTSANYQSIQEATEKIAALGPDFISVTYGAGGGTSDYTVSISAHLQEKYHVPILAHLSCINSSHEGVKKQLDAMRAAGIENVLALRGDIPADGKVEKDYRYASELIREIREMGDFCIGAACYPEGHVESANKTEDILHLKEKVEGTV